jgi:sirohydrochlorin ferrochelatase
VIRTNVDAFSPNDLPGPTDDGRRPCAARLLADRLLQLGRTVILACHRLASGLLMFRPRRIAPAHIGASMFGMPGHIGAAAFESPAHVGARPLRSQPHLRTLTPLRAASVAARRLNRAFTCTSSIRGRRDYGS